MRKATARECTPISGASEAQRTRQCAPRASPFPCSHQAWSGTRTGLVTQSHGRIRGRWRWSERGGTISRSSTPRGRTGVEVAEGGLALADGRGVLAAVPAAASAHERLAWSCTAAGERAGRNRQRQGGTSTRAQRKAESHATAQAHSGGAYRHGRSRRWRRRPPRRRSGGRCLWWCAHTHTHRELHERTAPDASTRPHNPTLSTAQPLHPARPSPGKHTLALARCHAPGNRELHTALAMPHRNLASLELSWSHTLVSPCRPRRCLAGAATRVSAWAPHTMRATNTIARVERAMATGVRVTTRSQGDGLWALNWARPAKPVMIANLHTNQT